MPVGPKSVPSSAQPAARRLVRRAPTPASEYERPARVLRPSAEEDDDGGSAAPVRRAATSEAPAVPTQRGDVSKYVSTGWGGARQLKKDMPSDFAQRFTVPTEPAIIKFLQDSPFANYKEHWAEWLPKGSKLSYLCLETECPLCAIGDRPNAKFCFNLADFTDPANPVVAVLAVGKRVSDVIEEYANDRRTSPINAFEQYFSIRKSGSSGKSSGAVQTSISPVKSRDLLDEWDIEPLTEEELETLVEGCYGRENYVTLPTMEQLEQIAAAAP